MDSFRLNRHLGRPTGAPSRISTASSFFWIYSGTRNLKITPASTPNIIENDDDSDDNGDNNYDDDYDDDDYDDDAYTDTKVVLMMLIAIMIVAMRDGVNIEKDDDDSDDRWLSSPASSQFLPG